MKALMVNSTSGKIVNEKMRDQMYMRHLREVEKINNRQAENVARNIKNYKSINELHHKHKSYAFQWHNKEEKFGIEDRNKKIKQKISQIKSYFQSKTQRKKDSQHQQSQNIRLQTLQNQGKNPQYLNNSKNYELLMQCNANESKKSQQKLQHKDKRQHSLHYRYRKKRQQQIDLENSKLVKAIHSQRSSYLPKIYRNKQKSGLNSQSLHKQSHQIAEENEKI